MPTSTWIDGHLDLAYIALAGRDLTVDTSDPRAGAVTFPALLRGGVRTVIGTVFTESGAPESPAGYAEGDAAGARLAGVAQLDWYRTQEDAGRLRIVRTRGDLECDAPLRVVLLMEGADPIRDPSDAQWWHQRGMRLCGLAWARGTRWAGGNAAPGPLAPATGELISELDSLGVIHDVSHLSDGGFHQLLAAAKGAVVASHSNSRSLTGDSQRHLTDAQIESIGSRGGVVGLNLYGKFLAQNRPATVADALDHVLHVAQVAGTATIALGSDLDGGFTPLDVPAGVRGPDQYGTLQDGLLARGLTLPVVQGFMRDNWLRVLRAALPE